MQGGVTVWWGCGGVVDGIVGAEQWVVVIVIIIVVFGIIVE